MEAPAIAQVPAHPNPEDGDGSVDVSDNLKVENNLPS